MSGVAGFDRREISLFRFIHTADWQIGKAFGNVEGDAGAFLRSRRIETIKSIADLAGKHQVDAILVAGDVFETNTIAAKTIMQTLGAMAEFEGLWLLLPGNHDPATTESVWSKIKHNFATPNIVLLTEPEPYKLASHPVVVLPAPLQRRHEQRDLTDWFDTYESEADIIRIGLAHGSLDNRLAVRGEAPNTIADARVTSARLDYLALGDWHGTIAIGDKIWYSGTPEPDRFRANDPGNVLLVEIEGPGQVPRVEKIKTGYFTWHQIEKNVFDESDITDVSNQLLSTEIPMNRLVVRLVLTGSVNLETRAHIDHAIEKLQASVLHMDVDSSGLIAEPSAADLDQIEQSGFVRSAIEKLSALMHSSDPAADDARRALHLLYVEHKLLEQKA